MLNKNSFSFVSFFPYNSLQIKCVMRGSNETRSLRIHERFVAGSLAGATAQTAVYPMEVKSGLNMDRRESTEWTA